MVEIFVVIRKEKSLSLRNLLCSKGIGFYTWQVKGRGKEGGLRYKGFFREKVLMPFLPKSAFSIVTDRNYEPIVKLIIDHVNTGSYGDGKVFVFRSEEEVSSMKMIKAIIRPEKLYDLVDALEKKGLKALTTWDVFGRGKEGGIQVGETVYNEIVKTMVMICVEDKDVDKVVETITKVCHTGTYGDGKIFVCNVSDVWTIRTKERGL